MRNKLLLCIMDGYGLAPASASNAISQAKTPNLNHLFATYPHTTLNASGMAVGLPEGQMGNSEVGHLNIGAGRIVYQALTLIDKKVADGDFYQNEALLKAIKHAKKNKSKLHLFGLVSDGGVHSHINHLKAIIKLAKIEGINELFIHAFLDGRDVEPTSGLRYLSDLVSCCNQIGIGKVVSVHGRYFAMDRDKNFDRLDISYNCLTLGTGNSYKDPLEYLKQQYQKGLTDEFIEPGHLSGNVGLVENHDSIIHANFRPDRAIQLSTVITNPDYYPNYQPKKKLSDIFLVQMMKYADSVIGPVAFAIPPLDHILGQILAANNLKQLRIAETEKYAHVTFFFDGGINFDGITQPALVGCDRILVDSPKVATYDLKPEMAIHEVTKKTVAAIKENKYDIIILNFANCDMVGHTAITSAVIKAVEEVDIAVGKVFDAINAEGGIMLLTADHGNADKIFDEVGRPFTAHTTNPVPFLITDRNLKLKENGKLADIAPTILNLLGISVPNAMKEGQGISLLNDK